MDHRETFDAIADLYDTVRPDYPEQLFADIQARTNILPTDPVLEIGCGTGLATQGIVRLSPVLTALDPGPELLRVAKKRTANYPTIEYIHSTFENWTPDRGDFALIAAAQSLHWIPAEVCLPKISSLLRPGGFLAVFGNVPFVSDPSVSVAIQRAYAEFAPNLAGPPIESWYLPDGPLSRMLADSGLFAGVSHRSYSRVTTYTSREYTELQNSKSNHQVLPDAQRSALLRAINAAIDTCGGTVDVRTETHLYLAAVS